MGFFIAATITSRRLVTSSGGAEGVSTAGAEGAGVDGGGVADGVSMAVGFSTVDIFSYATKKPYVSAV
jgi:hypothetical protein